MEMIIVVFFVMLALTAAMAVGVIFGRRPIAGSCGGMKALGMEMECEVCGGNPESCEKSAFAPDATSGFSSSTKNPAEQRPGANELSRRVGQ